MHKRFYSGNQILILPPHHIHLIAWIIQHILNLPQEPVVTVHLHANQLCGKNHVVRNVLAVELDNFPTHGLCNFHGVNCVNF